MSAPIGVFYAYPYDPPAVGETIQSAITRLGRQSSTGRDIVEFHTWIDTPISGKVLTASILESIDANNVFACDLTYPNSNVSFELGYAIGKFKRIFASVNTSIDGAGRNYGKIFYSLLNMGYAEYHNHEELAGALVAEEPWTDRDQTLLAKRYQDYRLLPETPTILYIKPPLNSDGVIAVQEEFPKSGFARVIVDDPNEYSSQSLEWYAEKILGADAVVVHLMSTDHEQHIDHNTKGSLVAGMAHGFGKPILMLAHAPYDPPADYGQWLEVHSTAGEAVAVTREWLTQVVGALPHRSSRRRLGGNLPIDSVDLRSLFLGDPVAEHEADQIHEYFVETNSFLRAMEDSLTILIGRRGTGKTAVLYAIHNKMHNTRRHVTILKPIGYETHGLIRVLEEFKQRSERGFLIESLWKYLIYSEIATGVADDIRDRAAFQKRTDAEAEFLGYYERYYSVLAPPFSERVEGAVRSLHGVGDLPDASEQRLRISERLHAEIIGELRRQLGLVLVGADGMMVLIDGLDEPWGLGEHVSHLSELIAGLIEVGKDMPRDFRRASSRLRRVDARVAILLRSDIFSFVEHLIPERDKLPISRVTWSDRELLVRVLEERMMYGLAVDGDAAGIWQKLFPDSVDGLTARDFVLASVLPRPRDLIHFVRGAVGTAIDRGHATVEAGDLVTARARYSQYAFNSILNEDDPRKGRLESVLYEFAGASRVTKREVESRLDAAQVAISDREFYLDLLCDLGFLGIESASGFRYPADEEERRTLRNVARVLAANDGRDERFEVNPAFDHVLQIDRDRSVSRASE